MNATWDVIDLAIIMHLITNTEKEVGYYTVPDDQTLPYAIVYPQGGRPEVGSLADPHEDAQAVYNVTSVGADPRQARWMSSKVQEVMLDYDTPITITGVTVQGRSADMLGAVMPSGEDLYTVTDIYRVRIGV